jgi:predicted  nucleic acid-binding Zn-ribbon protein
MWLLLFAPYTRFPSVMLQKLSDSNTLTDEIQNLEWKVEVLERRMKTVQTELKNVKNEKELYKKTLELKLEEFGKKVKVRL